MKQCVIFLVIFLTLPSCSSNMSEVPVINLQNPKQTKVVKLSEMLKDFSLVKLETSKDILIGEHTFYLVSEKFIITAGRDKILLFSNTGKYLKTIAVSGNGPNEYSNIVASAFDDKNDILYINQRDDPGTILAYNLIEDKPVKKIRTGIRDLLYYIVVFSDTVLAISPGINTEYNFIYLSTSGTLLSSEKPPEGIGLVVNISKVSNSFYYKPKQNDTVYIMDNYKKIPFCFIKVDNRLTLTNHEKGNFGFLSTVGSNFMVTKKLHGSVQLGTNIEAFIFKPDNSTYYWIDKKNFSVSEIKGFHNDFFGIDEPYSPFKNSLLSICNDFGFLRYSAIELKQILKHAVESSNLSDSIKLKINKFNEGLNEYDNPVMIIGKLK